MEECLVDMFWIHHLKLGKVAPQGEVSVKEEEPFFKSIENTTENFKHTSKMEGKRETDLTSEQDKISLSRHMVPPKGSWPNLLSHAHRSSPYASNVVQYIEYMQQY